jgi:hypothetical protein
VRLGEPDQGLKVPNRHRATAVYRELALPLKVHGEQLLGRRRQHGFEGLLGPGYVAAQSLLVPRIAIERWLGRLWGAALSTVKSQNMISNSRVPASSVTVTSSARLAANYGASCKSYLTAMGRHIQANL